MFIYRIYLYTSKNETRLNYTSVSIHQYIYIYIHICTSICLVVHQDTMYTYDRAYKCLKGLKH